MIYTRLVRPWLFRFDPETVHEWAVWLSRWTLARNRPLAAWLRVDDPVVLAGLRFPNRIGLAAGFDKNAQFIAPAETLGFGHIEVGAVTPLPQAGHPRPRLFRVGQEGVLRNRMGFNNDGADAVVRRIPPPGSRRILVGLNLGKGAATPLERAAEDYLQVLRSSYERVDYFSINVSSPNTTDLRDLGRGALLRSLALQLVKASSRESERRGIPRRPLWLKVSPDQSDDELKEVADIAAETGLDGLIASNTTTARLGRYASVDPQGGLSGLAVRERSCQMVTLLRERQGPGYPLIGVGGVTDEASARAMRSAGADLVQIYTGFVYEGPSLPHQLARALKGWREP